MKLKTKLLNITDAEGNDIDVEYSNVGLYLNGKKHALGLRDVITDAEYDDGEIYGNTLLGYYNVTDDGKLFVKGSEVELRDEEGRQIKVTSIERPRIHVDKDIPFEEVQKFVLDFEVEEAAEVFPDTSEEEKNVFAAERELREATTRKQKADADKALAEAEAERVEKEKADADKALRAKVKPEHLYTSKRYREVSDYYKAKKCTEYISENFHVWFGKETVEEPCLFIQRGKDWLEQPEPQASYEGETPAELLIEFNDMGTERELIFNTETGSIKLLK